MIKKNSPSHSCVVCDKEQKFQFTYQNHEYFRCSNCMLMSTYPYPDKNTLIEHYASKFDNGNYQLLFEYSKQYSDSVYRGFAKVLLEDGGLNLSGMKVLDIGCFTGEFLNVIQESGADVYGVELQSQAVDIANQKLAGRIFQADVYSNDFPQMKFELISMLGVIEHVVDPIKLISRVEELLAREGWLMIQTPNSGSLLARILRKYWPPYAPVEHIHLFSRQSLEITLKKRGFEVVIFQSHWKWLPIIYVYNMLRNYGPEFYRLATPIYKILPNFIRQRSLPFYVGEMIILARKL